MIEAVIWDFGGVLTTSPFEAFARYETERGLPVDIIRRTNAANHLENAWAKFERAEIGIDAFDAQFATESKALGAEVRGKDVLPLLSGDLRPEMVEALKRQNIPVAYLEFEGEGHGFRRSETIVAALNSEFAFYARVLGLEPQEELPGVRIHNEGFLK